MKYVNYLILLFLLVACSGEKLNPRNDISMPPLYEEVPNGSNS